MDSNTNPNTETTQPSDIITGVYTELPDDANTTVIPPLSKPEIPQDSPDTQSTPVAQDEEPKKPPFNGDMPARSAVEIATNPQLRTAAEIAMNGSFPARGEILHTPVSREPFSKDNLYEIEQQNKANENVFDGNKPLRSAVEIAMERTSPSEKTSSNPEIEALTKEVEELRHLVVELIKHIRNQGGSTQVVPGGEAITTTTQPNVPNALIPIIVPAQPDTTVRQELNALTNTPEQRYKAMGDQISQIINGRDIHSLSMEEKAQIFDIQFEMDALGNEIVSTEQKSEKDRRKKDIIITAVSAAAGVGLAIATPALVPAAVIGVTLGGSIARPLLKKFETSLRNKANDLKYTDLNGKTNEEIEKIEKKIKRNTWWANRIGEVASIVGGGSAGYGFGNMVKGLFQAFSGNTQQSDYTNQANPAEKIRSTASIDQTSNINNVNTTEGPLVSNGHVNLPGSAWNGTMAGPAAQDTLQGGILNYSNYNGGSDNMAAYMLNKDLAEVGIKSSQQLLNNLSTPQIHQLLNNYNQQVHSQIDPDLIGTLNSMGGEYARFAQTLGNR